MGYRIAGGRVSVESPDEARLSNPGGAAQLTLPSLVRRLAAEKPVPVTANMTVRRPARASRGTGQH